MPRRRCESVFEPSFDRSRNRWRVEHREADGSRKVLSFKTREGADVYVRDLRALLVKAARSVEEAIGRYEKHLIAKGNKPTSYKETVRRMRIVFKNELATPLDLMTQRRAEKLYGALTKKYAADSHRNFLSEARSFMAWCQTQGWVRENPFANVKGVGRRKRGKPQLGIDESRRFYTKALELARLGDQGAVASLLALVLALRASEIISLRARDVDDGGRILWVRRSKTEAGVRSLEVPEPLPAILTALKKGMKPHNLLLGEHWRDWVRKSVARVCGLARVPRVPAHGLRGTHATLAREHGTAGHVVAMTLGHTSPTMHETAYAAPGTVEKARRKTTLRVLEGGR